MSPSLSLVLPCFNEEEVLPQTARALLEAFAGEPLELILVDNGSQDRTGEVIAELGRWDPRVRGARVAQNRGYGLGVRTGLALASGDWLGFLCADGQVAPEDVRALWLRAQQLPAPALLKVRRRFRPDGGDRKLASLGWNALANLAWGGLGALDVNGNPKLWPRLALDPGALRSDGWFLDAEVLIEAKRRGLPVQEREVRGRARQGGRSHVRLSTCGALGLDLLRARLLR